MALEDYFETEVGVAVAATAALFSPRVRKVLRRGAVYGVAGALIAGDAVVGFAKGVGRGAQQAAASANQAASEAAEMAAASTAQTAKSAAHKTEDTTAETARTAQEAATDAKGARKGAGSATK